MGGSDPSYLGSDKVSGISYGAIYIERYIIINLCLFTKNYMAYFNAYDVESHFTIHMV